jgi:hypothetical protein
VSTDNYEVKQYKPWFDKTAISKSKRYKSPGIDQIPAEMIQTGSETLHSEICNSLFGIRQNYCSSGSSPLLYLFTRSVIKLTAVIIE